MNNRDSYSSLKFMLKVSHIRVTLLMFIVALFAQCAAVRLAHAVVLGFMPGDAFFHSRLSEDMVTAKPGDGPMTLDLVYHYAPTNVEVGAGYAGFHKLRITNIPESMCHQLLTAYQRFREEMPKELRVPIGTKPEDGVEINGFELFIYNKDVDWSAQRLAVKYNEDWWRKPDEKQLEFANRPFGASIASQSYHSFLKGEEPIIHDWKLASTFGPLKAKIPEHVAWGFTGPPIDEAVVVDAKDIQIVILLTDDLDYYFAQDPRLPFASLTAEGIDLITWDEGGQQKRYKWDPARQPYGTIDDLILMDTDARNDTANKEGSK